MNPISWLVGIESRLAEHQGRSAKEKLEEKYPEGLEGRVTTIYRTRAKRRGWRAILDWFSQYTREGYIPSAWIFNTRDDIYEVVYHAHLLGPAYEEIVLSLFDNIDPDQTLWMPGRNVRITEYGCISRPLHRFFIDNRRWDGADVEIYPQEAYLI